MEDEVPFICWEEDTQKESISQLDDAFMDTTVDLGDLLAVGPFTLAPGPPFYSDPNPPKLTRLYKAEYRPPSFADNTPSPPAIPVVVKRQTDGPTARREAALLTRFQFSAYCPRMYGRPLVKGPDLYFAVEPLTIDLFDLRVERGRRLDGDGKDIRVLAPAAALRLTIEGCRALAQFHSMGYAHYDVKPSNFMIRSGDDPPLGSADPDPERGRLKLIDFGLSCRFRSGRSGRPWPPKSLQRLIGTVRYASPSVHRGLEPRRADDLVSLFYTLYELICGWLPWQPWENDPHAGAQILRLKTVKFPADLLVRRIEARIGGKCRHLFNFVKYVDQLTYDLEPDYDYLIDCLQKTMDQCEVMDGGGDGDLDGSERGQEWSPGCPDAGGEQNYSL